MEQVGQAEQEEHSNLNEENKPEKEEKEEDSQIKQRNAGKKDNEVSDGWPSDGKAAKELEEPLEEEAGVKKNEKAKTEWFLFVTHFCTLQYFF